MNKKEHGRPSKEKKSDKLSDFSGHHATAKALASVAKTRKKYYTKSQKEGILLALFLKP